jgi:hypothetical protein
VQQHEYPCVETDTAWKGMHVLADDLNPFETNGPTKSQIRLFLFYSNAKTWRYSYAEMSET